LRANSTSTRRSQVAQYALAPVILEVPDIRIFQEIEKLASKLAYLRLSQFSLSNKSFDDSVQPVAPQVLIDSNELVFLQVL
jgi:hypothetical protein